MTISDEIRNRVRQRACFVCEYCGVTETDTGGLLTIDHFQPKTGGGSDDLIYCCNRCNQYKLDYWSAGDSGDKLWNPRCEPFSEHFTVLDDGTLYSMTATGAFTLKRLRLNRPRL